MCIYSGNERKQYKTKRGRTKMIQGMYCLSDIVYQFIVKYKYSEKISLKKDLTH